MVFVLDRSKKPLDMISHAKARILLKNKQSIRYYFHLGNLTIFACKSNVYDDVCLILEKLGLPSITKDEFSLIQKKMKDHERNSGMYSRAVLPCPLDFEARYIAEDLEWD